MESAAPAASQSAANVSAGSVEQVAAKVVPSVVALQTDADSHSYEGSGIILTADGLIMTNAHVVSAAADGDTAGAGGAHTTVTFADGRTTPFSVVAADPTSDIAVIRAQGISGLTPATLGTSGNLRVGQQVLAVGSPLGLDGTVTTGLDRERLGDSARNARRRPNRCPDEPRQLRRAPGQHEWPGDRDELGNCEYGHFGRRAEWFDRSWFRDSRGSG
jgi:S1-C subfamily serine protease